METAVIHVWRLPSVNGALGNYAFSEPGQSIREYGSTDLTLLEELEGICKLRKHSGWNIEIKFDVPDDQEGQSLSEALQEFIRDELRGLVLQP